MCMPENAREPAKKVVSAHYKFTSPTQNSFLWTFTGERFSDGSLVDVLWSLPENSQRSNPFSGPIRNDSLDILWPYLATFWLFSAYSLAIL